MLALDPPAKAPPVGCLAHGGRGDGSDLGGVLALGDRLHPAEGDEGPLDRLLTQLSCVVQPVAEPGRLAFLVQHPIRPVVIDLHDDESDRVGADVDGG